ncbi:hypothetical protein [Paenarthrobacter nitroguajacolicus]|uniref:hypothetical protein n=1 Tax=Paenarthrobacter nitroguajacolicus TaxID=211146 RepID=UPI00248B6CBA|nr:hypothetical protein [Paenarthrobacter nitroguajacolicus]MDI2036839.1 hypothetical protein [Paenarthrobacter nitroguajacolicus]
MTKPPIPDNPLSDFMNSGFAGTFDWSLLAMLLMNAVLVFAYVAAAAAFRQAPLRTIGNPAGIDLAFGTAIAVPLASLIAQGSRGLFGGLIVGGFASAIGVFLWGQAHDRKPQARQQSKAKVR